MVTKTRLRAGIARVFAAALVMLLAVAGAGPALGHEGHKQDKAPAEAAEAPEVAEPFPVDIGGPFALIDHTGKSVTDADFRGRYMLIFFGYAQCDSICPVVLKHMTEAVDLLGEQGEQVQPILITVDPKNDTPKILAAHLPTVHPRLVGLTGKPAAIEAAMKSYKVNARPMGQSWKGTPVISHGSYIYLMGPDGALLSILPPVLSAEAMAGIIARYIS
jgi:protein SCO1/2